MTTTTDSISIQAAKAHPLPEFTSGQVIGGRFEVLEKLGEGMLGAVYKVTNTKSSEVLALKIMRPQLVAEDVDIDRFNHELSVARNLDHEGIVKVYESGQHEGSLFFTSEYVEGSSLRAELNKYKSAGVDMPAEEMEAILFQLLDALQYAHETTIHRDLKPENILLQEVKEADGSIRIQVRITDFAIAHVVSPTIFASSFLSREGAFYLAPEMNEFRDKVAPNSDLFSVGAMLYEMLLSYPPVGTYDMPSEIRSGELTPKVDDLVEISLAPNPQDRFQSAEDMATAIEQTFSDLYVESDTNLVRLLALLLILAVAAGGAIVYFKGQKQTPEEILANDITQQNLIRDRVIAANGAGQAAPAASDPKYEGMVYIPGGTLLAGRYLGDSPELAARQGPGEREFKEVPVKSFWIDSYEMHYAKKEIGEEDDEDTVAQKTNWNEKIAMEPIREITWPEAKGECERRGKRLCSEDEWERACKGPKMTHFAYGDEFKDGNCAKSGYSRGDKVDGFPACKSAEGAFGLSGGMVEWTSTPTPDGRGYVVKPGGVGRDDIGTRCAGRSDRNDTFAQIHLGARCCAD